MNISWDYYYIFYHVTRHGSFSKAAKAMLCGQPNLSKTISNMEEQLGCKLFIRSRKGITLTPEGQQAYQHAKMAFEHLNAAESEILAKQKLESGIISIATTEIALYGSVLPALHRFKQDHPGVKIHLTNFTTPQALQSIKSGLADFAVVTLYKPDESGFIVEPIRNFKESLYCPANILPVNNLSIALSLPYISLEQGSQTYKFCQDYLYSVGIKREPDIEVATADQILPLIKSGIGVGFLPDFLATEALYHREIEKVKLPSPLTDRTICIVYNKGESLNIAAQKFKNYILSTQNTSQ